MEDRRADEGEAAGKLARVWDGGEGKEVEWDDEGEGNRREAKCSRFRCDMNWGPFTAFAACRT